MLTNLKISRFKKPIYQNFSSNIENKTLDTLSNMLAIDYEIRLQDSIDLDVHADQCVENLKKFLKNKKTFKDNDFSSAVMLFSIAIAAEKKTDHEKDNKIDKQEGLDQVIETLISMHFTGITKEERSRLRFVLKDLLNGTDIAHILNYIHSEPKLIKAVVMSAFKKYQTQIEINNYVKNTLSKIIAKTVKIEKKITKFKQLSGKVFTATCLIGTGFAAMFTGGLALPALILPAAVLSVTLGPKIGASIGGALKSFLPSIKEELKEITKLQKQAIYVAKKTELMEQKTDKVKDNHQNMAEEHVLANLGLELKTKKSEQIKAINDTSIIATAAGKEWGALVNSNSQGKDFKINALEHDRSNIAQNQSKASELEKNKATTMTRRR